MWPVILAVILVDSKAADTSPIIHTTMITIWVRSEILPMLLAILAVILVDSKTKKNRQIAAHNPPA